MHQKYVLVTGSSRGIGRAAALKFAAQGFHVFLNCRRSLEELSQVQKEILSEGASGCTPVPGDVGNPDEVRQIFDTIHSQCPALDVLVNNAGISHTGLLIDMTDAQWNALLAGNLSSAFYCSREALKRMVSASPDASSIFPPCGEPAALPVKPPTPPQKPV